MTFTFKTKKEYFSYRAEWRQKYADVSQRIRDLRENRRNAQRACSKLTVSYTHPEYWSTWSKLDAVIRDINNAKNLANELLEERKASKKEAGRQMEESGQSRAA